jgi:hypothetical protein
VPGPVQIPLPVYSRTSDGAGESRPVQIPLPVDSGTAARAHESADELRWGPGGDHRGTVGCAAVAELASIRHCEGRRRDVTRATGDSRRPAVVPQQAAQSFLADDSAAGEWQHERARRARLGQRPLAQGLVGPLGVEVGRVLRYQVGQVRPPGASMRSRHST